MPAARPPTVRRCPLGACLLVLTATLANAQTEDPGPADERGVELPDAVARAAARNPDLARLESAARALDAVPEQAGALPDPTLSLGLANLPVDTFDLDQEPMTQVQLGISQTVPFPGKRSLRRDAAELQARAADHRLAERHLSLAAEVRTAWWEVFHLDRALDIVTRNQELMRDFVEIARAKYEVGDGLQQDVLLAQLELSRLMDRKLGLEGRRQAAAARLNALMDLPPQSPLRLPARPPNTSLPELPDAAGLLERAAVDRPLLAAQRDNVEAASARLDLSRREAYPDLRLGAGYGYRRGEDPLRGEPRPDFFSVTLSVDLPVRFARRQGKAIEQRVDEHAGERHALDGLLREVEAAIFTHKAAYEAARRQETLLRTGIVPQAEQTVSSMLAGYQVDKVDFLNVVTSQITLYNARISYWEALAAAKRSLAQLAAAVGREALYE